FRKFYLQPFVGLQFDGVRYKSPARGIDYQDHYAILGLRTGLFLMLRDTREKKNRLVVGLGLETQRPLYVRGSVFSQATDQESTWELIPDPPALEQWGLYWTLRLGAEQKRTIYSIDLTISSRRNSMLSSLIPTNPVSYTSLRFSVLTRLFSTDPKNNHE
ncbi:MAG TPA: hypothetical protein VKP65_17845, partial [Rhodothermales bacterium]|nr:hypothetical protein [Rhodothermales bacterium]